MQHFPHLGLGVLQLQIAFWIFGAVAGCVFLATLIPLAIYRRHKKLWFLPAFASLLLSLPLAFAVDVWIGQTIFRPLHLARNDHMPSGGEILEYKPGFSYLDATIRISESHLRTWVASYQLKEDPPYEFSSLRRPNGQGLEATYTSSTQILQIHYNAF